MAKAYEYEIPKISLNGKSLSELLGRCVTITVEKKVGCADIVNCTLHGFVEIEEEITTNFVYVNHNGKKYRLLEVIEAEKE